MKISIAIASALAVAGVLAFSHSTARSAAPFAMSPFPMRGELDCNGFSNIQRPLDPTLPCADPLGKDGRGEDNGHYIGHDEPSVGFYSDAPRSGFDMQWMIQLPVDNPPPSSQTYENQIAFWLGLALCVPDSYPQNPCTPDSDANRSGNHDPKAAGSGFLEMQFYPPGHPPFIQYTSCDPTRWCASRFGRRATCTATRIKPSGYLLAPVAQRWHAAISVLARQACSMMSAWCHWPTPEICRISF